MQKLILVTLEKIESLNVMASNTVSRISVKLRTYLGRVLTDCLNSELIQKKYLSSREGKVYDIINVQESSRFTTLGGLVAHNCVLGMSYDMTKTGLAVKLTEDTGKPWTEDQAQELIEIFKSTYCTLYDWKKEKIREYKGKYLKLPCGWYLFGDNDNFRSVGNFPVQGTSASILRKAIDIARSNYNLDVRFPLHDAIYIHYKVGNEIELYNLGLAMREAFCFYFENKKAANLIRLDYSAWSKSYDPSSQIQIKDVTIYTNNLYLDKRAKADFDRFSVYFKNNDL